jgi:hypothetical protein
VRATLDRTRASQPVRTARDHPHARPRDGGHVREATALDRRIEQRDCVDELTRVGVAGAVEDLAHGPLLDHAAREHDDHTVDELLDDPQVVEPFDRKRRGERQRPAGPALRRARAVAVR